MIPLYDTVRSRRFPFINYLLIVINILAFVYEIQLGNANLRGFIFKWGLMPAHFWIDPSSNWTNILSSMFLPPDGQAECPSTEELKISNIFGRRLHLISSHPIGSTRSLEH